MPREVLVYVGIGGKVVAIDDATGTEVWRAELRADADAAQHHIERSRAAAAAVS